MAKIRKCIDIDDYPNPGPRDIVVGYPYGTQIVDSYIDHLNRRRVFILEVDTRWLMNRVESPDIDAHDWFSQCEESYT